MLYAYRCEKGHETEIKAPLGEAPDDVVCPICGREARRVFVVSGIVYRGTGWAGKGHGRRTPGPLSADDDGG